MLTVHWLVHNLVLCHYTVSCILCVQDIVKDIFSFDIVDELDVLSEHKEDIETIDTSVHMSVI